MKTYYLYRHVRHDKNEVFYIGIGTINLKGTIISRIYPRAYTKDNYVRDNKIWQRIISKTKYTVEIMLESIDLQYIKQQEIFFIKLYGRINLKTGTLANLTNGGDGCNELKHSKETKEKIRQTKLGKISPLKGVYGSKLGKKVFVYLSEGSFIGEYPSIKSASRALNLAPAGISGSIIRRGWCKQFRFFLENMGNKIESLKDFNLRSYSSRKHPSKIKNIACFDSYTQNKIQIFENITQASMATGITKAGIWDSIHNNRRGRKYFWRIEN